MTLSDLFITPVYLILFGFAAYLIRPLVTTRETRKYFFPALYVRFAGAIALGLIYQFYYAGGDTFNYFTHGSRWIWEAFKSDPLMGIKLLTESGGERVGETFEWSQHIWYYRDEKSFFVVRITAFFDLFTLHTYSATALFYAAFSFSGLWAMYAAINTMYHQPKLLAYAILFVPSVVFWGSGILKDTITLGALGWLTWATINMVEFRKWSPKYWLIALCMAWMIFSIKSYIVICYVPLVFVWVYLKQVRNIRNTFVKVSVAPILLVVFGALGYFSLEQISSQSDKYSLDSFARQAAVTAYDIRYGWGARTGGDGGYDIGLPDGTIGSMVRLMPAAVNVSLFRPYIWEVRNPLMLLSSLEAMGTVLLTLLVLFKGRFKDLFGDPFLLFCLLFAILFGFAVGVSTFNFGTLMRYKIPMMMFYFIPLAMAYSHKRLR